MHKLNCVRQGYVIIIHQSVCYDSDLPLITWLLCTASMMSISLCESDLGNSENDLCNFEKWVLPHLTQQLSFDTFLHVKAATWLYIYVGWKMHVSWSIWRVFKNALVNGFQVNQWKKLFPLICVIHLKSRQWITQITNIFSKLFYSLHG